jgi:hypothetical protein
MELITLLLAFFLIGGIVITAIVMSREIRKHRPVKAAKCADYYIVDNEARMTATEDAFLRTHSTRVKVSSSSTSSARK